MVAPPSAKYEYRLVGDRHIGSIEISTVKLRVRGVRVVYY